MVSYFLGSPWEDSPWRADREDEAFRISAEVRDRAKLIAKDPTQYGASQHLGHNCLVVVREAHPYEKNRPLASLQDVLGIALGPGASIYIEQHRTWRGGPDRRDSDDDVFARNGGDCSQLVREPHGAIKELHLSDEGSDTAERALSGPLGTIGAYYGMRLALNQIDGALSDPRAHDEGYRFFTGPEGVERALGLMSVGHQFAHPALQEWQSAQA